MLLFIMKLLLLSNNKSFLVLFFIMAESNIYFV